MNVSSLTRTQRIAYLRAYQKWRERQQPRRDLHTFIPGVFTNGMLRNVDVPSRAARTPTPGRVGEIERVAFAEGDGGC